MTKRTDRENERNFHRPDNDVPGGVSSARSRCQRCAREFSSGAPVEVVPAYGFTELCYDCYCIVADDPPTDDRDEFDLDRHEGANYVLDWEIQTGSFGGGK